MNKYYYLIIAFTFSAFFVSAQEKKDRTGKEIHFGLNSITPISTDISFKKPRKQEGKYFKFEIVNLRASSNYVNRVDYGSDEFKTNLSAGIEIGWEKRIPIGEKLFFYRGINLGYVFGVELNKVEQTSGLIRMTNTFYVPYTLGLMYQINEKLIVSVEMNPSVRYTNMSFLNPDGSGAANAHGFAAGFSPLSGTLSVGYRF
jgi:hypothetical protein